MPRNAQDVTHAEQAVLQVLWESGPSTIRDITAVVYPDDAETQYSTVKRLLARLETKRFVRSDKSGFAHVFTAAVSREELVGRRLETLADSLCEGSISPLLSSLARSQRLTAEQQDLLLSLIDELKQQPQRKTKRKPRR
jgi:predicted transcriptional regulator